MNPAAPQEFLDTLASFTMDFLKAMLRTGYYAPEHPGARKAKSGLFNSFKGLMKDKKELTYIKRITTELKDVMVDGVFPEPSSFKSLIPPGTAELFIPKFLEYFARQNLVSFTLKDTISDAEFDVFIDIMSEPAQKAVEGSVGRALTIKLLEHDVMNVSTIFDVDMTGIMRKLPWRVELALTRLKKDLTLLPMFKKVNKKVLEEVKSKVIDDIVRPLGDTLLLKDLLLHCDLIEKQLHDAGTLDIEGHVIQSLSSKRLPAIVKALSEEYEKSAVMAKVAASMDMAAIIRNRARHLMKKVSRRLVEEKISDGLDILLSLHSKDILTMEELSEEAKAILQMQKMADHFLETQKETLSKMDDIRDPEIYGRYILQVTSLIPELLRRGSYASVSAIAEGLARHSQPKGSPFTVRPSIAGNALICFSEPRTLAQLQEVFISGKKEAREEISRLFLLLGKPFYNLLIKILLDSEDRWVRKHTCRLLTEMGKAIEDNLIMELKQKDRPWYFYRNIISILGDMKSEKAGDAISEYGFNAEPRLKIEVLDSLVKIFGKNSEQILIESLEEEDFKVRARAIDFLGTIRSANKRVIYPFIDMVKKREQSDMEPDETLQVHVCRAFESIGNRKIEENMTVEDVLIESLKAEKTGILGIGAGSTKRNKSHKIRLALCETLGIIGTKKSLDVLKSVAKEGEKDLKEKAQQAVNKISGRAAP